MSFKIQIFLNLFLRYAPKDDETEHTKEHKSDARNEFWLDIQAPPASEWAEIAKRDEKIAMKEHIIPWP